MTHGRPPRGCRIRVRDVNDNERKPDEAQAALSELRDGFSEAKKLVRRTRSLLKGEIPVDENEAELIVPAARVDRCGNRD
jgi:hypothetical protein